MIVLSAEENEIGIRSTGRSSRHYYDSLWYKLSYFRLLENRCSLHGGYHYVVTKTKLRLRKRLRLNYTRSENIFKTVLQIMHRAPSEVSMDCQYNSKCQSISRDTRP